MSLFVQVLDRHNLDTFPISISVGMKTSMFSECINESKPKIRPILRGARC